MKGDLSNVDEISNRLLNLYITSTRTRVHWCIVAGYNVISHLESIFRELKRSRTTWAPKRAHNSLTFIDINFHYDSRESLIAFPFPSLFLVAGAAKRWFVVKVHNYKMDEKWLLKLSTIKNTSRKISIILKTTTSSPLNLSSLDSFDEEGGEFLSSLSLLLLIILYGIVVFSGVCGNSTLLISLCSPSTTRVKNPLLLALCAADLLVTLVSAPLTIIGLLLRQSKTLSFSMANIGCKVFHYMQVCWVF